MRVYVCVHACVLVCEGSRGWEEGAEGDRGREGRGAEGDREVGGGRIEGGRIEGGRIEDRGRKGIGK